MHIVIFVEGQDYPSLLNGAKTAAASIGQQAANIKQKKPFQKSGQNFTISLYPERVLPNIAPTFKEFFEYEDQLRGLKAEIEEKEAYLKRLNEQIEEGKKASAPTKTTPKKKG
jgi:cell shape-determining protein MreC